MRTEQRLVLFVVLSIAMMWGMQFAMDKMGWLPRPQKPVPEAAQAEDKDAAEAPKAIEAAKAENAPAKAADSKEAAVKPAVVKATAVKVVDPEKLVMGSVTDKAADGYRLQLNLTQRGAGVESVGSSRFEAEFEEGKPRHRPLQFIHPDRSDAPSSFSMALILPAGKRENAEDGPKTIEVPLDVDLWEVVPDEKGQFVRPIKNGQEVQFRLAVENPAVVLTKTYRLHRGQDGFEMDLGFESPNGDRSLAYRLSGPHGIPIEGEWYTGTFRDVFFGRLQGSSVKIDTYSAYDVVKRKDDPERFRSLPLKFAGVENQYFAVLLEPALTPEALEKSWDEEAYASVVHEAKERQKSDISVQILSKPVTFGPNNAKTHSYRVFAGPKKADALAHYGAEKLSAYRKGWSLGPLGDLGASWVATNVIAPMLDRIYKVTEYVARMFGGTRGNYGVAIILLTMTVRLILFPLGRKQAAMAKRMQELQPQLQALKDKYKDDKDKIAKETFALYKKHNANPVAGCIPALVQLPVLIGLWQALNNSVDLRHSSFLWIKNLAAPDMLMKFPIEIPYLSAWLGPYFNVLPLIVVGLMMVQTKLFSPPAVTEEAKMQQSTMKFMMIFMMFMFYKVPSGLGIYFITSSLWQISERLLLPKNKPVTVAVAEEKDEDKGRGGSGGGKGRGGPGGDGPGGKGRGPSGDGARGWFNELRERVETLANEASKDKTHRNDGRERDRERGKTQPRPGRKR